MKKLLPLLILIPLIIHFHKVKAQEKSKAPPADSLISLYEKATVDTLKLKYALKVGSALLNTNVAQSLSYLEKAKKLLEAEEQKPHDTARINNFKYSLLITSSTAYSLLGDIDKAVKAAIGALNTARQLKDEMKESGMLNNLATYHQDQGNFEEALRYYRQSLVISQKRKDDYGIGLTLGNIGTLYGSKNRDSSVYYYKRSLPYLKKIEDHEGRIGALGWMMNNIGSSFEEAGNIDSAFHYYFKSMELRESINHVLGQYLVLHDIGELYYKQGEPKKALTYLERSIKIGRENGFKYGLDDSYLERSEILESQGEFKSALKDYRKATELKDSLINEKNRKMIMRQSLQYEYAKKKIADSVEFAKAAEIKDLEIQKQRANLIKQRVALASSIGGLLLILALAFSIYRGKKRSDELLLNILPSETAKELKKTGSAKARQFDKVTVIFTDFKDFTLLSEKLTPQELVAAIDECFQTFDKIMEKYGIEKIKTIGDAYMAAGGLPVPNQTNAVDVVKGALEMRDFIVHHKEEKGEKAFEMRIGVHTGPVVAGIVGIKKFQYDIWGDTVNTASRMETSGEPGKVNISGTTYELVKDEFLCEHRGKIKAKNKGDIDMYFVDWK